MAGRWRRPKSSLLKWHEHNHPSGTHETWIRWQKPVCLYQQSIEMSAPRLDCHRLSVLWGVFLHVTFASLWTRLPTLNQHPVLSSEQVIWQGDVSSPVCVTLSLTCTQFPPCGLTRPLCVYKTLLLFSLSVVSSLCVPIDCSPSCSSDLHHLPQFAQTHVH